MKAIIKILLCFLLYPLLSFAQIGWNSEVLLNSKEEPLRNILSSFISQTKINLIFNDALIENKTLSISIKDNADKTLSKVLKRVNLSYKKFNENSAVIFKSINSEITANKKTTPSNNTPPKKMEDEIVKPTLVSNIGLRYPEEAIKKKLEGEVRVRLLVSRKGRVKKVTISKSSGFEILDTATVNHIKRLKFLPAEINGKKWEVWTTMKVKFNFE